MNFEYSDLCKDYLARVRAFMDEHIYPNEPVYAAQMAAFGTDRWQVPAIIEDLKAGGVLVKSCLLMIVIK